MTPHSPSSFPDDSPPPSTYCAHPASHILHPASRVPHPASCIPLPAGQVLCPEHHQHLLSSSSEPRESRGITAHCVDGKTEARRGRSLAPGATGPLPQPMLQEPGGVRPVVSNLSRWIQTPQESQNPTWLQPGPVPLGRALTPGAGWEGRARSVWGWAGRSPCQEAQERNPGQTKTAGRVSESFIGSRFCRGAGSSPSLLSRADGELGWVCAC